MRCHFFRNRPAFEVRDRTSVFENMLTALLFRNSVNMTVPEDPATFSRRTPLAASDGRPTYERTAPATDAAMQIIVKYFCDFRGF